VLTVFKDKASADASVGLARDIWGGLSNLLKGQPKPETFDNVETLISNGYRSSRMVASYLNPAPIGMSSPPHHH